MELVGFEHCRLPAGPFTGNQGKSIHGLEYTVLTLLQYLQQPKSGAQKYTHSSAKELWL